MDKTYWNDFYKKFGKNQEIQESSTFAKFCQENFFYNKKLTILEFGSGNGRDAKFFAKMGHKVIAVDQSHEAVKIIKESFFDNIIFIEDDFVKMDFNKFDIDVFYSRFTLHSITEEECKKVIEKIYKYFNNKSGFFMIEARTTKDKLCGVGKCVGKNAYITDHYRRFIDSQEFLKNLLRKGFKLLYFIEKDNLSIYKDDNPVLLRVIFKKDNNG